MTVLEMLSLSPNELAGFLLAEYCNIKLPDEIDTVEDLELANKLIPKLINGYSFLMSVLSYAKIQTRDFKRAGDKIGYEDAIDKRDLIFNVVEVLKLQYKALSRMVTIKQEINQELHMSD